MSLLREARAPVGFKRKYFLTKIYDVFFFFFVRSMNHDLTRMDVWPIVSDRSRFVHARYSLFSTC